jgi:hypothetical protein
MADLSVFGRQKSVDDYMRMQEEFDLKKRQALMDMQRQQVEMATGTATNDPAALRLANEYLAAKAAKDMDKVNALELFAKVHEKGIMQTPDGQYIPLGGMPEALGQLKYGENYGGEQATQQVRSSYEPGRAEDIATRQANVSLAYDPQIEKQKLLSREQADKIIRQPREIAKVSGVEGTVNNVVAEIDRARGKIDKNFATGGFLGAVTQGVPGTPAFDVKKVLTTIKANLGFAELQKMRDASPTGGALGQVAVQELEALQSTIANLDMGQSDEDLKYALGKIERHLKNWQDAVSSSYQQNYEQDPLEASRRAILQRNAEGIKNPYQTLPPSSIDPALLEYMTPKERALFE